MAESIKSHQRGIGLPIIIALIVVIIGGAAGAYYFINKDKDSGPAVINSEIADKCNEKLDDKDLCKLAASWSSTLSYTANIRSEGEGQQAVMTIKNDGKGNTHSKTEVDGTSTAEIIVLGNTTYSKYAGADVWTKLTSDTPDTPNTFGPENFDFDFEEEDQPKYTKQGKEACGNLTCFKYTFVDEEDASNIFTMWFDDKDYLVRKISGATNGGMMEITYDYGSVTISEPSPVQDFNAQTEPTSQDIQRQIDEAMRQAGQM